MMGGEEEGDLQLQMDDGEEMGEGEGEDDEYGYEGDDGRMHL